MNTAGTAALVRHLEAGCLLAWGAYLLFAPTVGVGLLDSWHDEQRAVQFGLLAITSGVFILRCLALGVPQVSWPLIGVLALGLLSAVQSEHRLAALAEIGLMVQLAVLVMTARNALAVGGPPALLLARRLVLLIGAAHAVGIATRCFAALQMGGTMEPTIFMLGYANPRFPSALYVMLMPLLAWHAVDAERPTIERVATLAALCMLWFANIGLGTRGVWLALPAGVISALLLCGHSPTMRIASALAASALVGVLMYLGLALAFSARAPVEIAQAVIPSGLTNSTLTGRDALWLAAAQAIRERPWFGLGPMGFASLGLVEGTHPHNWLLQVAAEFGLPALALLLAWLLVTARLVRRLFRTPVPSTVASHGLSGLAIAVASALALGMVDGNLLMPISQTAAAIVLGALLSFNGSLHESTLPLASGSANGLFVRLGIASTLAILLILTATFAISSHRWQETAKAEFRHSHPFAWLTPRLWEHGVIDERSCSH